MGAAASINDASTTESHNIRESIKSLDNNQLVEYLKTQHHNEKLAEWIQNQGWTGSQALEAPADAIPEEYQTLLPQSSEDKPIYATLKQLPEALESAVYVHEKQPLVIDPTGQAARFFKYQRGTFLSAGVKDDMDPSVLRRSLVGALKHGSTLSINFDVLSVEQLSTVFSNETFPVAILNRQELFMQSTWEPLLCSEDPSAIEFIPRDEFKFVIISKTNATTKNSISSKMQQIIITTESDSNNTIDPVASALGYTEVIRNSIDMPDAAFEGDLEAVKLFLEKGFHIESQDGRKHTSLSEAACQGHNAVISFLLEQGADPNALNDENRSPLFRASYNGHLETVTLLLQSGGDPRIATKSTCEIPYDVGKTPEVQQVLIDWDTSLTDKLLAERAKKMAAAAEERLTTHAAREDLARCRIREDLIVKTIAGDVDGLRNALLELVSDALRHNLSRPRGSAEARDSRGCTLLALAAQHNKAEVLEMLLNHWKTCDEDTGTDGYIRSLESRTFRTNPNSRDGKGWTPAAIAVFHNSKKCLSLLLDAGADPTLRNQYHKNAIDLCQDELDAAGNVMRTHTEVRLVIEEWQSAQLKSTLEGAVVPPIGEAEPLPNDGGATLLAIESLDTKAGVKKQGKKKQPGKKKKKK